MANRKITDFANLAGAQTPTMIMPVVDPALGAVAAANLKSTLNDLFADLGINTSDGASGLTGLLAAPAVSAATKVKFYYHRGIGQFLFSRSAGAYYAFAPMDSAAPMTAGNLPYVATGGVLAATSTPGATINSAGEIGAPTFTAIQATAATQQDLYIVKNAANTFVWSFEIQTNDNISVYDAVNNKIVTTWAAGAVPYLQMLATAGINFAGIATVGATSMGLAKNSTTTIEINSGQTIAAGGSARDLLLRNLKAGIASSVSGTLVLANSGSAFTTTLQAGVNLTASRTYTWPTDFGVAGSILTDAAGNGTLSWSSAAGITGTIAATQVAYGSGANAIAGDSLFLFDTANKTLAVGTATTTAAVISAYTTGSIAPLLLERFGAGASTRGKASLLMSNIGYTGGTGADSLFRSDWGWGFQVNNQSGSPVNAMIVTNSELVGIGNTNPTSKLHVSRAGESLFTLNNSSASSNGSWTVGIGSGGQHGHGIFFVDVSSGASVADQAMSLTYTATSTTFIVGKSADTTSQWKTASSLATLQIVNNLGAATTGTAVGVNLDNGGAGTYTSGDRVLFDLLTAFSPTSGTGTLEVLNVRASINQTGGASGITRGVYVNPTLTAVADWRAIEVATKAAGGSPATNTALYIGAQTGATVNYGIYQTGTATYNFFNGASAFGGVAVNPNILVYVNNNVVDPSATVYGGSFARNLSLTGANSQIVIGLTGLASTTGSAFNSTGRQIGVEAQTGHGTTATASNQIGINAFVYNQLAGTITTARAGNFAIQNLNVAGTITNAYSVYVNDSTINGFNAGIITNQYGVYIGNPNNTGTLTNNYGLYVASQTSGGTLNYAIYSAGGASLLLAGTSAVTPLTVRGATSQSVDLQQWQTVTPTVVARVTKDGFGTFGSGVTAAGVVTAGSVSTGGAYFAAYTSSQAANDAAFLGTFGGSAITGLLYGVTIAGSATQGIFNTLLNSENATGTADCSSRFTVGGGNAGDPYIRFTVSGVTDWAIGIDNSDSDKFVISASTALGTANILTITVGGVWTWADAINQAFSTGTGSQIGTAASQKIGHWGVTPVVQPSTTGTTAGFTAGAGTNVTDQSTFTGNTGSKAYTIGDIVLALKQAGFMAAS